MNWRFESFMGLIIWVLAANTVAQSVGHLRDKPRTWVQILANV